MAGRPQTRARREAAQQSTPELGAVVDAIEEERDRPSPQRPPLRSVPFPGPRTRHVTDTVQANQMSELAKSLRPGVKVVVERMRPTWCAGIVEDFQLEVGSTRELIRYIKDTYGGERYKVSVLHPDDTVAFESSLTIAGAPLDQGRPLLREPLAPPGPAAAAPDPMLMFSKAVELVGGILRTQQPAQPNTDRIDRLERLVANFLERAQEQRLSAPVPEAARPPTLAEQLREMRTQHRALAEIGAEFAPPEPAETDTGSLEETAMKHAMTHFLTNFMGSTFPGNGKGAQQTAAPAPPRAPAYASVQAPVHAREIPQNAGQNREIVDL